MKKTIMMFFSLLVVNLLFAQERAIKITNEISGKERIIKENKRIRFTTVDGQKVSGRFMIEEESIIIREERFELTNIQKIKRNPLSLSIATDVVLIGVGTVTIFVGIASAAWTTKAVYGLLAIPGAGIIYAGIKSPNFLKGYQKDQNWTFEIVTNSE